MRRRAGVAADGFSLVEALIALTMLSAGVLALGAALSVTNRAARDSLEATVAEHLARNQLDRLRSIPYADLRDGVETVAVDQIAFTRRWRVARDTPRSGMSQIRVDVSWSEYAAPLTKTLSDPVATAISDPLGTVDRALTSSGRTRSRTLTGLRVN